MPSGEMSEAESQNPALMRGQLDRLAGFDIDLVDAGVFVQIAAVCIQKTLVGTPRDHSPAELGVLLMGQLANLAGRPVHDGEICRGLLLFLDLKGDQLAVWRKVRIGFVGLARYW